MSDSTNRASELASHLAHALSRSRLRVDDLAERTKVPRSTLRLLLGESVTAVEPGRVYLRGHLRLVIKELHLDEAETLRLFDAAWPDDTESSDVAELPRVRTGTLALAAGIVGVGLLAVILSILG